MIQKNKAVPFGTANSIALSIGVLLREFPSHVSLIDILDI
jgi:hypothetical protein